MSKETCDTSQRDLTPCILVSFVNLDEMQEEEEEEEKEEEEEEKEEEIFSMLNIRMSRTPIEGAYVICHLSCVCICSMPYVMRQVYT
jgi:hypothetical protein